MSNLLGLEEAKPSTGEYDNAAPGPDPEWTARVKRGANWFYWIAGLSVVNSLAFIGGAQLHFLGGLGLTELADAVIAASINEGAPTAIKAVSIIFDLVAVTGFALAGYYANKFVRTAFLIGIIIYGLDTLIVLALGAYFMAAFHAFALYSLINGYIACRQMKAHLKSQAQIVGQPPPPPSFT